MSSNIRIPKICLYCGKEFIAKTTVTKFCSDNCAKRNHKKSLREEKLEKTDNLGKQLGDYYQLKLKDKEFLSIKEVSELLGASRMTIYRQIKSGTIKATKLGRRTIIKRTEIDKLFIS